MFDRIQRYLKSKVVELRPSRWARKKKKYVPIETVELLFALLDKQQLESYLDAVELVKENEFWVLPEFKNSPPPPPRRQKTQQPEVEKISNKETTVIDFNAEIKD